VNRRRKDLDNGKKKKKKIERNEESEVSDEELPKKKIDKKKHEQEIVRQENLIKKKRLNGDRDKKKIGPYVDEKNLVTETQAVQYFFDHGAPQYLLTGTNHIIYPLVLKEIYPDVVKQIENGSSIAENRVLWTHQQKFWLRLIVGCTPTNRAASDLILDHKGLVALLTFSYGEKVPNPKLFNKIKRTRMRIDKNWKAKEIVKWIIDDNQNCTTMYKSMLRTITSCANPQIRSILEKKFELEEEREEEEEEEEEE
jgi:hypothetical protein